MSSNSSVPAARRLEGKVAVITGGASGIGECTAKLFVKHGAKVVIGDIQDELGLAVCKEVGSDDITYVHCDVTSDADVKNAVDTAVAKYGKLDIMYNNAGVAGNYLDPRITAADNEEFKRDIDVNLFGSFLGAKHAATVMIPAKKGVILFNSSTASVTYGDIVPSYAAAKNAVVGLAKSLAVDLGQHGIRVNAISAYAVATPMVTNAFGQEKKKVEEIVATTAVLKGTVLEPEDVAEAALYLSSDESKYVSGINMLVDGAYSLTNPSFGNAMKALF